MKIKRITVCCWERMSYIQSLKPFSALLAMHTQTWRKVPLHVKTSRQTMATFSVLLQTIDSWYYKQKIVLWPGWLTHPLSCDVHNHMTAELWELIEEQSPDYYWQLATLVSMLTVTVMCTKIWGCVPSVKEGYNLPDDLTKKKIVKRFLWQSWSTVTMVTILPGNRITQNPTHSHLLPFPPPHTHTHYKLTPSPTPSLPPPPTYTHTHTHTPLTYLHHPSMPISHFEMHSDSTILAQCLLSQEHTPGEPGSLSRNPHQSSDSHEGLRPPARQLDISSHW